MGPSLSRMGRACGGATRMSCEMNMRSCLPPFCSRRENQMCPLLCKDLSHPGKDSHLSLKNHSNMLLTNARHQASFLRYMRKRRDAVDPTRRTWIPHLAPPPRASPHAHCCPHVLGGFGTQGSFHGSLDHLGADPENGSCPCGCVAIGAASGRIDERVQSIATCFWCWDSGGEWVI